MKHTRWSPLLATLLALVLTGPTAAAAPQQQSAPQLRHVSTLGGDIVAAATDGQYAYLAEGLSVVVRRSTAHGLLEAVGRSVPLPQPARAMAAGIGSLYLFVPSDGLFLLDVANPALPTLHTLSEVTVGQPEQMTRDGPHLVTGGGRHAPTQARVFDVTQPTQPRPRGVISDAAVGHIRRIAISNDRLFIAGEAGVAMLALGGSGAPRPLATLPLADVTDMALTEGGLVVLTAERWLAVRSDRTSLEVVASAPLEYGRGVRVVAGPRRAFIISHGNDGHPDVSVSTVALQNGVPQDEERISIQGNISDVASWGNGLLFTVVDEHAYEVALAYRYDQRGQEPSIAVYRSPTAIESVALDADRMVLGHYATGWRNGVVSLPRVIQRDPGESEQHHPPHVLVGASPSAIALQADTVLVAGGAAGEGPARPQDLELHAVGLIGPAQDRMVLNTRLHLDATTRWRSEMAVSGDWAVVAGEHRLQMVDIATPEHPQARRALTLPGDPTISSVAIHRGVIYIGSSRGLWQVALGDALAGDAPQRITDIGRVSAMALVGQHGYISSDGLYVIDIGVPDAPEVVNRLDSHAFTAMVADGELLYGRQSGPFRLQAFDLGQPDAPTLIGERALPTAGDTLAVHDGRVAVPLGEYGLLTFAVPSYRRYLPAVGW